MINYEQQKSIEVKLNKINNILWICLSYSGQTKIKNALGKKIKWENKLSSSESWHKSPEMAEQHGEAIKGLSQFDNTDVEVLHDRWGILWAFLLSMCYVVIYLSWAIIYQKYINKLWVKQEEPMVKW